MALLLPNFFKQKGYLQNIKSYRINSLDLVTAKHALASDIDAFFLNGLISFSSTIHSLNKSNYSWAFIQSYYSLFFLARAFIGINGYCIVYINSKPFRIKLQPSEMFIKLSGTSHDVVFKEFKNHFSSDILISNCIENKIPIDWFKENRNLINYSLSPLTDPEPPISLFAFNNDIRKWIATYLNDDLHAYTFDPVHCYISYPIQLFNRVFNHYIVNRLKNRFLDAERIIFFKSNFSDKDGPISVMIARLTDIMSDS